MQDVVVVVESVVEVVIPRTYSIRPTKVDSSFSLKRKEDSIITMTFLLESSISTLAPPVLVG